MRKVKDAKDLSSNELIYFKGHAKATYMSDGSTVEDAINNIEIGAGGDLSGYATKEELGTKLDIINDLTTIREGAILGTTAVQPSALADVATSGDYNDLSNRPTIPDISSKQDKLVSGTNIKTINGTSILGSGDITIENGSGSSNYAYPQINHGTSDTTFALTPNIFHVWDEIITLDLSFASETEGVANEYLFQFTSGITSTTLTLSDNIKWTSLPNIQANKIYLISILNNLGSILEFEA